MITARDARKIAHNVQSEKIEVELNMIESQIIKASEMGYYTCEIGFKPSSITIDFLEKLGYKYKSDRYQYTQESHPTDLISWNE